MQNLKENWLLAFKITQGIWLIFMRAVESLKILHFDGLLLRKAYKVLDEKILKSYVSWHWRVMQSLKKDSWFQKWHEEFGEF